MPRDYRFRCARIRLASAPRWIYSNIRESSSSPRTAFPVPEGKHAATVEDAVAAANEIGYPCVVKAQVRIGGRGKAGGIKVAKDDDEARAHAEAILGMDIRGFTVHDLWVEQASEIDAEYYASIILDRSAKKLLVIALADGRDGRRGGRRDRPRRPRPAATSSPANGLTRTPPARSRSTPGSTRTSSTRSPRCWSSLSRSRRRGRDADRGQPADRHHRPQGRRARRQGDDRRQRALPPRGAGRPPRQVRRGPAGADGQGARA